MIKMNKFWMASVTWGCGLNDGWTQKDIDEIHLPAAMAEMMPKLEGKAPHATWREEVARQCLKNPQQFRSVEREGFTFRIFTAEAWCGNNRQEDRLSIHVLINGDPYRPGDIHFGILRKSGDK